MNGFFENTFFEYFDILFIFVAFFYVIILPILLVFEYYRKEIEV